MYTIHSDNQLLNKYIQTQFISLIAESKQQKCENFYLYMQQILNSMTLNL